MRHHVFPRFDEIFPNQKEERFEDLLSKVSSIEILKLLSKINRDLYLNRYDPNTSEKVLIDLCSDVNESNKNSILNNYRIFKLQKRNYNPNTIIFLQFIILDLMIEVFKNINFIEYEDSDKNIVSLTTLKGLLICNSIYNRELLNKVKVRINQKSEFIAGIHQHNFSSPRDISYLLNLSSEFFLFLENSSILKPFLTEFLVRMNIDNYRTYINAIIEVSIEVLMQKNYRLSLNTFYKPILEDVLDYLSIDFTKNESIDLPKISEKDYKILRDKPLLKIKDNTYCILDQNFLLDKLYLGMIFGVYRKTELSSRTDLYKDFSEFTSYLGTEFAEKQLFHKIIPNCFIEEENIKMISGDSFQEEYSDFYVRENDNLFLFEFKNYIIRANIKNSLDCDIISKEVTKKLYEEEVRNRKGELLKVKSKGVKQLINSINKVIKGGYHFDNYKDEIKGKLYIYPILVYTDDFFNVEGMHRIVDKYYEDEITKFPKGNHQVNRLILISLQDLIRVSYTINKRKISFAFLLDLYHEKIKELSRLSRIQGRTLTIPHFTELIKAQLIDLDAVALEALISSILGDGIDIMTGLIFDQSEKDTID